MLILTMCAIADGIIVGRRLMGRYQRRVTPLWIILGILYFILALLTIISGASLILGSIIVFGPLVIWILRIILFGTRG